MLRGGKRFRFFWGLGRLDYSTAGCFACFAGFDPWTAGPLDGWLFRLFCGLRPLDWTLDCWTLDCPGLLVVSPVLRVLNPGLLHPGLPWTAPWTALDCTLDCTLDSWLFRLFCGVRTLDCWTGELSLFPGKQESAEKESAEKESAEKESAKSASPNSPKSESPKSPKPERPKSTQEPKTRKRTECTGTPDYQQQHKAKPKSSRPRFFCFFKSLFVWTHEETGLSTRVVPIGGGLRADRDAPSLHSMTVHSKTESLRSKSSTENKLALDGPALGYRCAETVEPLRTYSRAEFLCFLGSQ